MVVETLIGGLSTKTAIPVTELVDTHSTRLFLQKVFHEISTVCCVGIVNIEQRWEYHSHGRETCKGQ
jgi:hypothetical protein